MPNWAEGNLKIRGKKQDVEQFIKDQLVLVKWEPGDKNDEEQRPVELSWEGDETLMIEEPGMHSCIWIRGTSRNFIDFESAVPDLIGCCCSYLEGDKAEIPVHYFGDRNEKDCDILIILPYKAAWSIHEPTEELYRKWSEEYHLKIRIYVVESGWGFFQTFTFDHGKVLESAVFPERLIGDEAYSEFLWECPFPGLGG